MYRLGELEINGPNLGEVFEKYPRQEVDIINSPLMRSIEQELVTRDLTAGQTGLK